MDVTITDSLAGLINFFAYFCFAVVLMAAFCLVYGRITPYPEFRLVKEGKVAPAISLGGAVLGFVIPLASAVSHSVSFVDMALWAVVALVVQIAVFLGLRLMFGGMVKSIADDGVAEATLLAVFSLAAGILNAASMSY